MFALVAQSRQGLMLQLVDAGGRLPAQPLLHGGPLYFSWAPDGRALAIHNGMELTLFDMQAGGDSGDVVMRDTPTFRTPVWTVDGDGYLFTAPQSRAASGKERGGAVALWQAKRDGSDRGVIGRLDGAVALLRAPRDDLLAVIALPGAELSSRGLRTFLIGAGPAGPRRPTVVDQGAVAAAFWAPDASALYYITAIGAEADLALVRCDLRDGGRRRLASFRPSAEFATLLAFFDQYAQSHSLISPDGRWITFAGLAAGNGGAARRGFGPQNGCYVVPTDGSAPARRVANGDIGFFPPPAAAPA